MVARRKSAAKLEATGAFKENPNRCRADLPEPLGPFVDKRPACFTEEERAVWRELVASMNPGMLRDLERPILEVASRLLSRFRRGWLTAPCRSRKIVR